MSKHWILIAAASLGLSGILLSTAAADEEKEENEQKISFEQAPAPVRKTLMREAEGQTIKNVDKEQLKGKTVYEADVKLDGHNYEIVVDEKGLLLDKKLDEEDEKAESKGGQKQKQTEKQTEKEEGK